MLQTINGRNTSIFVIILFVMYIIAKDQITVDYIPTADQPADVLTESLGPQLHHRCVEGMGLCALSILSR